MQRNGTCVDLNNMCETEQRNEDLSKSDKLDNRKKIEQNPDKPPELIYHWNTGRLQLYTSSKAC